MKKALLMFFLLTVFLCTACSENGIDNAIASAPSSGAAAGETASWESPGELPEWRYEMPRERISSFCGGARYDISLDYTVPANTDELFFSIKSMIAETLPESNELVPIEIDQAAYPESLFSLEENGPETHDAVCIKYYGSFPEERGLRAELPRVLFLDESKEHMLMAIRDEAGEWSFFKAEQYAPWFLAEQTLVAKADKITSYGDGRIAYSAVQDGPLSVYVLHKNTGNPRLDGFLEALIEGAPHEQVKGGDIPPAQRNGIRRLEHCQ